MTDGRATPPVVAVVGPTGVGKTALAVALGRRLGAEMLLADSRQLVRGLRVGTCAPTSDELRGVPCHLADLHDPGEPFNVADWLACAVPIADDLARRGVTALVVGGTGLYVGALLDGLVMSTPPEPGQRRRLEEAAATPEGLDALAERLRAADPAGASRVDLRNPRRVVRALELVEAAGSVAAGRRRGPRRQAAWIGLDAPREVHDRLVEERARRLLGSGALLLEVESALQGGVSPAALDAAGIGYREALAVLDGRVSVEQAVADLARRTRRYAKAQRTWFRRDPRIRWFERGAAPAETLVDGVLDALHEDARPGE